MPPDGAQFGLRPANPGTPRSTVTALHPTLPLARRLLSPQHATTVSTTSGSRGYLMTNKQFGDYGNIYIGAEDNASPVMTSTEAAEVVFSLYAWIT